MELGTIRTFSKDDLLADYFEAWIELYKKGSVRRVTLEKYLNNLKQIQRIAPNVKLKDVNRKVYQQILNIYAEDHEKQTVIDFHHQIKGMLLDAVDEDLIPKDPTRKAIFKGKAPRAKKRKYLNQFELHNLLEDLNLGNEVNVDWLILLIAKTGIRYAEALGVTPKDFDFRTSTLSINKTWDYKTKTGFQPTKNKSSVRTLPIDFRLAMQFQNLVHDLPTDKPIFVGEGKVCNSTPNKVLERHCKRIGIEPITVHGLRHTHASLLMGSGVSIASISKRLGHSSINTTQKVYVHLISELENQDNEQIMRYLSALN